MKILMLGCGNADLSADMYDNGYKNITNVDFSKVVIEQMTNKNGVERPQMTWQVLDITDMSVFETDTFDIVIDKSSIDCLFCTEDYILQVASMLKEVQRVIKPKGNYLAISHGQPKSRASHFNSRFLSWDYKELFLYDGSFENEDEMENNAHYIYSC